MKRLWQAAMFIASGIVAFGLTSQNAAAQAPQGQVVTSGPIVSAGTNKCLDVVSNMANQDGANVQQYDCSGRPNQTWQIVRVGPDTYAIVNQGSQKVLESAGQSRANAANVDQRRWSGQPSQVWKVQHTGSDTFSLVNVGSGKCLDLANGSTANGANIQQYDCAAGNPNQTWRMNAASAAQAPIPNTPVIPAAQPGATSGLGPNVSSPQQEQAERAVQIVQGPVLKSLGGNAMELQWKTNNVAANSVKYGTDPNNLSQTAYEPGGGQDHSITLKNLVPGQTYYYQILTRDGDVRYTGQFRSQ
jgi:hypothetical protein